MRESVTHTVNGRPVSCSEGVVLASALLNGGWTRFRESRTGMARGPLCGMGTCHECRVRLDSVEHVRSCMTSGVGSEPHVGVADVDCEIAVIGGGPAGMAAAAAAAGAGRSVVVVDENQRLGGQIWRHTGDAQVHAARMASKAIARVRGSGAQVCSSVSVIDARRSGDGFDVDAAGETSLLRISAPRLVLATGARERYLPFPGWTLPGVFGAGGLQALVKGGFDVRGKRIVVAGSGPLLLAVAAFLRRKGARILVVAEQAPPSAIRRFARSLWRFPGKAIQAAGLRAKLIGIPYLAGWWPVRAEGSDRIDRVVISDGQREREFACDAAAIGFGLVPNLGVAGVLGCRIEDGAIATGPELESSVAGVFAAGEILGIGGVGCALIEGQMAGLAAAGETAAAQALAGKRRRERAFASELESAFGLRSGLRILVREESTVCRCEDVSWGRIAGFGSWRECKLQTRCGMGACQGRVCGPALEFLKGWTVADARPPLSPVPVGALSAFGLPATAGTPSTSGD